MKTMNTHVLLIFDAICLTFLSIHLTDIDTAGKIIASAFVIVANAIVIHKHLKK